MICWLYLLLCAARRRHALYLHQHRQHRTRLLCQQHTAIGRELLAALRSELESEKRLQLAGLLPKEVRHV